MQTFTYNIPSNPRPEQNLEDLLRSTRQWLDEGAKKIVLDFSECTRAFPNIVLPIIAYADHLRDIGISVGYCPPEDAVQSRWFLRHNWSHLLSPSEYSGSESITDRHLVAHVFSNDEEMRSATNHVVDCVLRDIEIGLRASKSLNWILWEVAGNILTHSESGRGYLQLSVIKNKISICIVDFGIGILSSIASGHSHVATSREAIEYAVRRGVTRSKYAGQGNGLSGSLDLAKALEGRFQIRSGDAVVTWDSERMSPITIGGKPSYPGTLVDVQFRHDKEDVDIASVISGDPEDPYEPIGVIEDGYLSDDLESMKLVVADEVGGFGTRREGLQMNTKCQNMLRHEPSARLIIDWDGIPIVASSYADEFVGRLFAKIGPMAFMSRVQMIRMDDDVRKIVDSVIRRRIKQED